MKVRSIALVASLSMVLTAVVATSAAADPRLHGDISTAAASGGCALGARAYTPQTDLANEPWVGELTYCAAMGGIGTLSNQSDLVWAVKTPYPVSMVSGGEKQLQMHTLATVMALSDPAFPTRFVLPGETVRISTSQFGGVDIDSDLTTRWHAFSIFVDALGAKRWDDAWECAAGATEIVQTDPATVWTSQELYDLAIGAEATGDTCLEAIERRATNGPKTTRLPVSVAPKNKVVLNSPTKVREWVLKRPGATLADDALDIVRQVALAVR